MRVEIEKLVKKEKITAGCLASIVGGLKKVKLRMAGGKVVKSWNGLFEIVSGTGTLSSLSDCHIHISVSDKNGKVLGGHLKEGCIVSNTTEIVLLKFGGVRYRRKFDKKTGYEELVYV